MKHVPLAIAHSMKTAAWPGGAHLIGLVLILGPACRGLFASRPLQFAGKWLDAITVS
jgi:hypothetical protein